MQCQAATGRPPSRETAVFTSFSDTSRKAHCEHCVGGLQVVVLRDRSRCCETGAVGQRAVPDIAKAAFGNLLCPPAPQPPPVHTHTHTHLSAGMACPICHQQGQAAYPTCHGCDLHARRGAAGPGGCRPQRGVGGKEGCACCDMVTDACTVRGASPGCARRKRAPQRRRPRRPLSGPPLSLLAARVGVHGRGCVGTRCPLPCAASHAQFLAQASRREGHGSQLPAVLCAGPTPFAHGLQTRLAGVLVRKMLGVAAQTQAPGRLRRRAH